MSLAYCLVLDILGFRAAIVSSDNEYQSETVDRWVALVDSAAHNAGVGEYQLISDSLFAIANPTVDGLGELLRLSRDILNRGFEQKHLVRGGIAKGLVRWNQRIAHGPAIVDAYELGENCTWVGVACTNAFSDLQPYWGFDDVAQFPVPTKRLSAQLRPAIVWDVPDDRSFIEAAQPQATMTTGTRSELSEAVLAKLRHTTEFRDYVSRCRRRGNLDASAYHRFL